MVLKNYFFHYIRKYNKSFPYFNFLHEKNFIKIIKNNKQKLIKLDENMERIHHKEKYIFSFDDSLKDHVFAANELEKNNILGQFFINTLPIIDRKILGVHKLHLMFGKYESSELIKTVSKYEDFSLKNVKIPTYKKYQLKNSLDKDHVTKLKLKIFLNEKKNVLVVNKIFNFFFSKSQQKKILNEFYLNEDDVINIDKKGMIIGGHSHSHKRLSSLSTIDQAKEIKKNIFYLSKILNKKIEYFASPFGDKNSYNKNTIKILKKNIKYHFTTETKDKKKTNYKIPRINCNQLKDGNIYNYKKNNDQ